MPLPPEVQPRGCKGRRQGTARLLPLPHKGCSSPKSIYSSPLSILMNRKGSWDPRRQQPRRLNPPKE